LLEGIEGIEKKCFGRARNGFEVNPGVGNDQLIARARDGDLKCAAFRSLAGFELLAYEEKHFGRRAGDVGRLVDLRGRTQDAGEQEERRRQDSQMALHEMYLLGVKAAGLKSAVRTARPFH